MARIRSVHPGLFTDEAFVSCSPEARLFAIGVWTECDDQGVFEWKPLTLKMRLAPADNIDPAALLEELSRNGLVRQFDVSGRQYGAVRNFRKYQRPKKPNAVHPLPDAYRQFVGLTGGGSEPVPHQSPTSTEKSPQMEDGGGKRKDKDSVPNGTGAAAPKAVDPAKPCYDVGKPILQGYGHSASKAGGLITKWLKSHPPEVLLPALQHAGSAVRHDIVAFIEGYLRNGIPAETQPERSSERVARAREILRQRDQENLQVMSGADAPAVLPAVSSG